MPAVPFAAVEETLLKRHARDVPKVVSPSKIRRPGDGEEGKGVRARRSRQGLQVLVLPIKVAQLSAYDRRVLRLPQQVKEARESP